MTAPALRPAGRTLIRVSGASFLLRRRSAAVTVVLLAALAAAVIASLSFGRTFVAFPDVLDTILGADTGYQVTVNTLRLPRTVLAVVAGAAFGLAGALIQSVARNPLASPDVIGVTQGAGLGATIALTGGLGIGVLVGFSLTGALIAAVLVFTVAGRGGLGANRFVLAGIAVAVALRAVTQTFLISADAIDAQRAQIWIIGTLNGRGWSEAAMIAATIAVLLPALVWASTAMNSTALDDDTARGLGVHVTRRRVGLAATGIALAAVATANVGAIEFVALVAPQVARRLTRTERPPLVCAALTGALLTVLADLIGRNVFAIPLPAGVVTAVLGGPYLILLLIRRGAKGTST